MKIALVSKLWEDASPTSSGGTGHVVGLIADGLVERGHEVTVFAPASSRTKAKVESIIDDPFTQWDGALHYLNLANAFKRQNQFDLINCWVDHTACFFAPLVKTPTLISVDYGDISGSPTKVYLELKDLNFTTTSFAMQTLLPFLKWQAMIYHGIDLERFVFNDEPRDYLLFLGRLSPQKGPHLAIEVAKRTNNRLILSGKPDYKPYLEEYVWPYVDGDQIQYRPIQSFEAKVELYRNAKALINPVSYIEAFGLTIIEAMACGTPVIAYANGAVAEVIKDGETGFVIEPDPKHRLNPRPVNVWEAHPQLAETSSGPLWAIEEEGIQGLVKAVDQTDRINRGQCRQRVEKYFTAERMVSEYERLFSRHAAGLEPA
jgi:glycosyltransferase involved in cell wall biosynthesis